VCVYSSNDELFKVIFSIMQVDFDNDGGRTFVNEASPRESHAGT
jgi:hypothetical protein